jgi:hypothetical protein
MHEPFGVRAVQRVGDVDGYFQGFIKRQGTALETFGERLALHIFHYEKIRVGFPPDLVRRADVRVTQSRQSLHFTLEAMS